MPRKSPRHVELVNHYLKLKLTPDWTLRAISGLDQDGVAKAMQESAIFMAFSELEGFGLPPIEAALCGNLVVGYHGEGGREYWHPPIFSAIPVGDIKSFVKGVMDTITFFEKTGYENILESTASLRQDLATRYSIANEKLKIQQLVERVLKTFEPA
jgi:glycosyltransferase involved in cell wall biosynthesis